jgi:hypothetical protein
MSLGVLADRFTGRYANGEIDALNFGSLTSGQYRAQPQTRLLCPWRAPALEDNREPDYIVLSRVRGVGGTRVTAVGTRPDLRCLVAQLVRLVDSPMMRYNQSPDRDAIETEVHYWAYT